MDVYDSPMKASTRQMRAVHDIAATGGNFQNDVLTFYQQWAENYDKDMGPSHYGGPAFGAEALNKVLTDKSALIVDCASGTGKVGEELAKHGFKRIHAVDFSQKCLDISASKKVYERLICDRLGSNKIKGIEDGYYSAVICVGAISVGHLSCDVFPEWNRIVKKGGYIVFTRSKLIFPDKQLTSALDEIQSAIDDLIKKGVWEVVDIVSFDDSFCVGYGCDVYTIRRSRKCPQYVPRALQPYTNPTMDASDSPKNASLKHIRVIHDLANAGGNTQDEIQALYQQWAESYDKDMGPSHYGGPAFGAEALRKVLTDKSALIVDCASGTGKVGEELAQRGFKRIHAVDFSQKCLDISASKGVYEKLICDRLGSNKIKEIEDGYYSAVICVGAISVGHLSCDVFPEWNRIVKKGGYIVFTRSKLIFPDKHTSVMDEIQSAIDDLIKKGVWEVVDIISFDDSFCVGYGCDVYTIRRL
ncbi:uncharacterized protein LOC119745003 [Patiria miniata]|uniref:Methyltransferase type 11 domain-containing protein n=1 Tax=Patiria miniata TaxID=46514 RepID=A0A914BN48_PATMI|nr:uncharacterized protein LOC119745003 [Patiria miniata]